jgi:hypothetical protein
VATNGNDAGPGTADAPFATIQHAVDAANPGDLIYVRAGTYDEAVTITESGEAGKPIIISCAPGDLGLVKVTPPEGYAQANPHGAVIHLEKGADYVWINGLDVEGTKGQPGAPAHEHFKACGILFEADSGIGCRVTNDVIYDCLHCGIKGGTQTFIQGDVIFDNGTGSLDHGIYMHDDNTTIDGNVIFNNSGWGVHGYVKPDGLVITHNVVFGNGVGGILLGGGDGTVEWNTVADNGLFGIMYFRKFCTGNVVEHNISEGNRVYDFTYDNGGGSALLTPTGNTDDDNVSGTKFRLPMPPGPHDVVGEPSFLNPDFGDFRLVDPSVAAGAFATAENPGGGTPQGPPAPSLLQAILGLYVAEVEKDIGFGDPGAVQQAIDFNAQYTVLFGVNLAPFIEMIADANVANARNGGS